MSVNARPEEEIEKLLAKLNTLRTDIGTYISHHQTDDGDYLVCLSQGELRLHPAELNNAGQLPPFRLSDILARFRPKR